MPKIDGKYNGKEKAVLMKYDGTVVFDAGQCDYMYYTGDGIHVTYMNKDSSEFAMDGSLIITYEKSKYDSMGWVGDDGYVPIKIGGKWGIYRVIDNPALKPLATQVPVVNQTKSITAPAAVKNVGVKATKKKMTITLPKKSGGVKGYVIQYSLNKKFKKASKVTVTKNKAVIKKLKSGKKYYVRVKAYNRNGSKKVFSKKWSSVKKVVVK